MDKRRLTTRSNSSRRRRIHRQQKRRGSSGTGTGTRMQIGSSSSAGAILALAFLSLAARCCDGSSSFLAGTTRSAGAGAAFVAGSRACTRRSSSPSCWATREDHETATSAGGRESRFGLRKRVKAVLKKAKDRTGLSNLNTEPSSSAASVVAETASIGGFDVDSDFVLRPDFSSSSSSTADDEGEGSGAYYAAANGSSKQQLKKNGAAKPSSLYAPVARNDTGLVPLSSLSAASDGDESDSSASPSSSSSPDSKSSGSSENGGGADVDSILNSDDPTVIDPLPFTLPTLTDEQLQMLRRGERVQEQSNMGREGSGYVVMDVKAPPYVVWECLLDFEEYPNYIGTCKKMTMFTNTHLKSSYIAEKPVLPGTGRETRHYGTSSVTRASFILSKFRLKIAAMHKYQPHPDGHYMVFTLDRACKNLVMQDAKGIWYTQTNPEGREGEEDVTRVWLLCEVKISSLLPKWIVDYAAKRAMPRATTWLPPLVEEKKELWLNAPANGDSPK